ncbi:MULTISPECIES: C4-dicarboxylate transporter DctA [Sphingobacterium]|jgi:aerobic C4-dicarboxylate transport protein|uniref:C4-dicarboxylate transporter DctA n=1 Tax=Sphingobacterium TaxID=28453 RepID=UPI000E064475|nr:MULTISPECIES: C4-dicarboxylate transporter DctA [Sphingobacterium]HAK27710.1 C4-dicarboxylate transporter DctA [Sphingobacterium sp.]MDF2852652.1 C4-dicarboxylate transporter DctA [Sphingobacterium multivorum]SUJ13139.1 Aerobic C4-dicarboxylate transport protein [Sphingobacterium multivorum]HAU51970.1 C4-dicarboxylate transporter DctA [Sphingobacterium sp.]HCX58032.1 C4-dicarboxylate transporter DctA [Sphingobacterium sp.]
MKHIFKSLYFQVIVGILVGIICGIYYPDFAVKLKPLGDAFIKLIKMVIAPLIFSSIVIGIAGMQDTKKVGKIGLTSIIYFEIMTTIALIIGLVFVNWIQPGTGMNADPASLDVSSISHYISESKKPHGFMDFIIGIIPDNVIAAVASDNMLQVLVFAVLFGIGMTKIGQKASEPVLHVLQSFLKVLFSIIKMIMYLAPIGAMGAMGFTIGKFGIQALSKLGMLMLSFYLTCFIFVVIVIGAVLYFYLKVNVFKFLKYIKEEILIVLGTSSSESALPGIMQKMEDAGCAKPVVGLVIPTGYSFNLDGTSIYLTMAAVFISQALNMHLSLEQEITLLLVLLLTSKGAAGVTGSGFVTLAATLPVVGHVPVESVALIFGVDRFMSEARAITNLIGNSAATLVISKYENSLDEDLLHEKLGSKRV